MPIGGGSRATCADSYLEFEQLWDGLDIDMRSILIRQCGYNPDENLGTRPASEIPVEARVQLTKAYLLYDSDTGD